MNNIDIYVKRMAKSIYDKLFFVDKIFDDDISSFIDFGCADGTLISYAQQYYDCNFIGYDNTLIFIVFPVRFCKAKLVYLSSKIVNISLFCSSTDKSLLLMISVIH